jgi:hypothetical protein
MAALWIGVGVWYPSATRARWIGSRRLRSENEEIWFMVLALGNFAGVSDLRLRDDTGVGWAPADGWGGCPCENR